MADALRRDSVVNTDVVCDGRLPPTYSASLARTCGLVTSGVGGEGGGGGGGSGDGGGGGGGGEGGAVAVAAASDGAYSLRGLCPKLAKLLSSRPRPDSPWVGLQVCCGCARRPPYDFSRYGATGLKYMQMNFD